MTWTAESEAAAWRRIAADKAEQGAEPVAWRAAPLTPQPIATPAAPEPSEAGEELDNAPAPLASSLSMSANLKGLAAREAASAPAPEPLKTPTPHAPTPHAPSQEMVNHPAHYHAAGGYEVIEIIEAWRLNFARGNALKYLARAGLKDPRTERQDLKKALWYIERELERLEREAGEECER